MKVEVYTFSRTLMLRVTVGHRMLGLNLSTRRPHVWRRVWDMRNEGSWG